MVNLMFKLAGILPKIYIRNNTRNSLMPYKIVTKTGKTNTAPFDMFRQLGAQDWGSTLHVGPNAVEAHHCEGQVT